MKTFTYIITDEIGIHARPAGAMVKEAKKFVSSIEIECQGKKAAAGRLMAVMGLGVKKDMEVTVYVEGEDEEAAAAAMETFFKENL